MMTESVSLQKESEKTSTVEDENLLCEATVFGELDNFDLSKQHREIVECSIRGGLKESVYVGDRVLIDYETKTVDKLLPRKNLLYRPVVANADYVLIVMAAKDPTPSYLLLDRMLVSAEYADVEPIICINKLDLADVDMSRYEKTGYQILKISVENGEGFEDLESILNGKVTVLAGPSGVGKSSMTSRIIGEELRVGEVSSAANRGKHTTRHSELFELSGGGILVDSPGFGAMNLNYIEREELRDLFPEFDSVPDCKFKDCLHIGELGCQVEVAANQGSFPKERYDSYRKLIEETKDPTVY